MVRRGLARGAPSGLSTIAGGIVGSGAQTSKARMKKRLKPTLGVTPDELRATLAEAEAELKRHLASWEYAFAMGHSCHSGSEHPTHWATRARTEKLRGRCRDLRALLAEHAA